MRTSLSLVAVVAVATIFAAGDAAAQACGDALGPGTARMENSGYTVAYRTQPAPVVVGQHFAVAFAVCPRSGATPAQSVRVDANMPAHKHGMNYRVTITRNPDGTYRAEGLMFHMPGRWDLTFDVVTGNTTQRLAHAIEVR